MHFARFGGVIIGLVAVTGGQVRVIGGGGRILCLEKAFRFLVMMRSLFIMVRGIVMVAGSRMLTGHAGSRR
jgi:hypothetical protein